MVTIPSQTSILPDNSVSLVSFPFLHKDHFKTTLFCNSQDYHPVPILPPSISERKPLDRNYMNLSLSNLSYLYYYTTFHPFHSPIECSSLYCALESIPFYLLRDLDPVTYSLSLRLSASSSLQDLYPNHLNRLKFLFF